VLRQEIRAKQLQTADRPIEQIEGLEQLIANVAAERTVVTQAEEASGEVLVLPGCGPDGVATSR